MKTASQVNGFSESLFDPVDICDLVKQFPEEDEPLIGGICRRGDVVNIIADPKAKKSWMAYDLAISICFGNDWLGKFPCTQGKVLLIDNELKECTIANRVPQVAKARNINSSELRGRLDVYSLRNNLLSFKDIGEKIVSRITKGEYAAIILDSKYRADIGEENSNDVQTEFYNLANLYADQTDAAWVFIHHASKGDQSSKKVTDVGSGGGAQSRAADAHIILREHTEDNCIVLDGVVRTFKEPEATVLRWCFPVWQPQEHLDPRDLKSPQGRSEKKQREKDRKAIKAIEDAYSKINETELSVARIKSFTGVGSERVSRLLNLIKEDGQASFVREEKTRNKSITQVYKLENIQTDTDGISTNSQRKPNIIDKTTPLSNTFLATF